MAWNRSFAKSTTFVGLTILVILFQNCSQLKSVSTTQSESATGTDEPINPIGPTAFPKFGDYPSILSNFDVNLWLKPVAINAHCGTDQGGLPDLVGAFRFLCMASHNLYDDPIVYPGKPGAAHLHTFFGNTSANAHSTYESLRTQGDGTCPGGPLNRSAYWIPSMMTGQEKVVMPDYIVVYYKRLPKTDTHCQIQGDECVALPRGLRMIFGYNMGLAPDAPKQEHPKWSCENHFAVNGIIAHDTIGETQCAAGVRVYSELATPNCWDGVNLDSADHRSHLAYATYGNDGIYKCPATHRKVIPRFTLKAFYSHLGPSDLAEWHLSSDRMPGKPVLPNGSSFHSDWFGAWDDEIMNEWTANAIDRRMSCNDGQLGTGRGLAQISSFKWYANPRLVDPPPMPEGHAH